MASSLLDDALRWARAGFFVLPLDGKVPLTPRGVHDATRDEEEIRRWFERWPEANVGAAMGRPFGDGFLVAIDVDPRNGGWESVEALEANGNLFPGTRTHWTGGHVDGVYGQHMLYVASSPMTDGKLAAGIDVKGSGYVVLPPSTHPDTGEAYEIADDVTPTALPAWMSLTLSERRTDGFAPTPIDISTEEGQRRIRLGEEAAKTMPPSVGDGEGGERLLNLCLVLVRRLELPLDTARALVEEHFNPRCTNPSGDAWPWSEAEIRHKLEDARDKSAMPCGILTEKTEKDLDAFKEMRKTPAMMRVETKHKVHAREAFDGERKKITMTMLVQTLYNGPDWNEVLWYDVLAQKPRATNPPIDATMTLERGELSKGDFALIKHWFDVKGWLASREAIEDALWRVVLSPDRQRNVIAEYLDALPKVESASVLPTLATDVFRCADPVANTYVMKTLVAAVRRARNPGHFHKSMLVLKGEQQCGKTPAVKILAGDWYYSTGNGNIADRDTILECQGKWLVEVEELSALNKADADALKTAISRTHDVITKKYEPDARPYARSFVLVGTTNKDEFLTDATGNARYWVVECGQIDLAKLERLRDQIWAEADFLARTTPADSNELDTDERKGLDERNKSYLNTHPWKEAVARYLQGKKEVASATEVLLHILKGDETKADTRAKNIVADLMRTLGCKDARIWRDGKTVRVWTVPDDIDVPPARANAGKVVQLRPTGR